MMPQLFACRGSLRYISQEHSATIMGFGGGSRPLTGSGSALKDQGCFINHSISIQTLLVDAFESNELFWMEGCDMIVKKESGRWFLAFPGSCQTNFDTFAKDAAGKLCIFAVAPPTGSVD